MTQPKWSFSSLKQVTNCARQYYEIRIAKNFTNEDTQQTLYGKDVHEALEYYVRDNKPLPKNYLKFKKAVDALVALPGDKYTEMELAVKEDRITSCDFDDPEYWVHGIADLVIVNGDEAFIVDYKTGKSKYADIKQLSLMALLVFAKFPEVKNIKAGLLFLADDLFIPTTYERSATDMLWKKFDADYANFQFYNSNNIWPANPTGLCKKHCPVSSCQYHGKQGH